MDLFPYTPRPFQEAAVGLVSGTVRDGRHLVLEMPTGSGKTVVLLAGALATARPLGKRVLYVSRTNSQQEQTVRELRAIQRRDPMLRAFALQGRARLCLKLEDAADPEWAEATPEELSHYCSAAKAATEEGASLSRACSYYAQLREMDDTRIRDVVGPAPQTAEWLRAEGRERGFCPYEATKRLIAGADVVVAPYVFALDSGLRRRLLDWWGCAEKDVVLVVDEAHNLPEYLRSMGSPRLTRDRLRRGLTEAKDLGDPEVLRGVGVQGFLEALALLLDRIVLEYSKEEDGFVPPFELEAHLMERYTTTSRSLVEAARAMQQLGEILKDRRRAAGKIPRSALGHVGSFLEQWFESDEAGYVKIAGREPQPYLEAFLVDTARLGELFQGFHATLHASGTLDPLEEYRDSLGLPESSRLERFPSHFPPNRLLVRAVAGMTTRYETLRENPRAVSNLQDALRAILERVRLNAACFFPSHRMMQDFREVGVFDGLGGTTWFEDRGMGQAGLMDLVARHRAESGRSLLVGVVGGRLSEGMDFPGRQLEVAVIVGVPYPKPTAHQRAVFHYHESRSDRGWEYAVRAPAVRRLRQALGRLVRSGDDRGFAIVLDERAAPLLSASGLTAPLSLPNDVLTELEAWQNEPLRATSLSETPQ